ncbi:hypothetical protein C0993_001012 [Termitomyces sp. T159_Od127]|nr:hypothetical protein C0993_001012 [Termitomyces sp. T159_Od127]
MASGLDHAPSQSTEAFIDVSLLKEIARKALIDSLNSVNGAKTLVLDATLAGPLGLVTEVSLLKYARIIADHIKRHAKESRNHTYTLVLVPRVSTLVTQILEEEGVLGDITISAYNLQFVPLADDVISLEYEDAFKDIWVVRTYLHLRRSGPSTSPPLSNVPASTLKKDAKKKHHLTTSTDPLLEELRDLNFSSVGKRLNTVARRLDENYKVNLQSKTVAQLRDFVGKLGGLQTEHQALRLHTGLSELLVPLTRTEQFNKSLEIQQNLLASYEVSVQISAIEEMIAEGADPQIIIRLLCLASITAGGIKAKSLENIKREILQAYGYNYLPLLLALASPSLGLLVPNPLPPLTPPRISNLKYPFTAIRKSLRLLIDDSPEGIDEIENDISFTYSGYAPISIRLVQCVAQKGGVISNPAEKAANDTSAKHEKMQAHPIVGWKGFEDVVASIPGETVDIVQSSVSGRSPAIASLRIINGASIIDSISGVKSFPGGSKTAMI